MKHQTLRRHRILIGDLIIISASAWLSFLLRLGAGLLLHEFIPTVLMFSGFAVVVKPLVLNLFGIYRIYWKYIGPRETYKLLFGSIVSSSVLGLVIVGAIMAGLPPQFPRSVIGIDMIISTLMFFVYRRLAYRKAINI